MSRHTPGPWRELYLESNTAWQPRHLGVYDAEEWIVAEVAMDNVEACPHANARLIAAAPELLAVLQEAVEWMGDDRFDEDYIAEAWYHAAVKAIDKATGEET